MLGIQSANYWAESRALSTSGRSIVVHRDLCAQFAEEVSRALHGSEKREDVSRKVGSIFSTCHARRAAQGARARAIAPGPAAGTIAHWPSPAARRSTDRSWSETVPGDKTHAMLLFYRPMRKIREDDLITVRNVPDPLFRNLVFIRLCKVHYRTQQVGSRLPRM